MNKRPRRPTGETGKSDSEKPNYSKKPTTGRSSGSSDFKKTERGTSRGDSFKKGDGKKDYSKPSFEKKPYSKSSSDSRGKFDKPTGKRDYTDKRDFDKPSRGKSDYSSADYRGKGGDKPEGKRDYSDKKDFSKPSRGKSDFSRSDDKGKFSKPAGKRDYTDKKDFDKPSRGKSDYSSSDSRGKFSKPAGKRDYTDKKDFDKPSRGKSDNSSSDSRGKFSKPAGKREYTDKKDFDKPSRGKSDYSSSDSRGKFSKPAGKGNYTDKKDFDKPSRGKSDYSSSDSREKFSKPAGKRDFTEKKSFDKPRGKSDYSSKDYKSKSAKPDYPKKDFVYKPPRGSKKDFDESEPSTDVRLNRFISNSGICSRREADELIKAGKVTVNKIVVTEMGYKVTPSDVVRYEGKILKSEKLQYVLLNKPKGFITTMKDDRDRKTVMSLVEKSCEERIYPVGRLDRNTTGLLLFTNDGDLAKRLTHPSYNIKKIYQVELDKAITQADFDSILAGIQLEDGPIKADDLAILTPDNLTLGVEIHSGRNRIIRRIFEHLGYQVEKLDRVMFGNLTKKNLTRGDWRHLTPQEVSRL